MKYVCGILVAIVLMTIGLSSAHAAAPTKEQCIQSNEDADSLRKTGHLKAAMTSLAACSLPSCPRMIRDDCAAHLVEVEGALPTVVFSVKDGARDVSAVQVGLDGSPFLDHLDGAAVSVDPGEHMFVFVMAGYSPQTRKLIVREGEKNRSETITFGAVPDVARPAPAHLVVTTTAGVTVVVDRESPSSGGFDHTVSPGVHRVRVTETGKTSYERSVDLKAGETQTLAVSLTDEKKPRSLTPWLIGGGALVAAALIVGGIALASSSSSDPRTTSPRVGSLGGVSLATFR